MNSSSAAVVNCDNQNNEKLAMRNLEITKYYKIKSKCETNGGVIAKTANKALIIIRKVTKKIEIDQYYTNYGNTNSSNISKNDDIDTYK